MYISHLQLCTFRSCKKTVGGKVTQILAYNTLKILKDLAVARSFLSLRAMGAL